MTGVETISTVKALDIGSIHKISSGQVVVDLQTAVKELVENSLDAGATTIEVRFKDYGLESFEVIDNGSGISPSDYDSIALKHHTSKLSSFTDLEAVTTFGFRGEALSSLCALAESVSVTTATAAEAPVGTVIEFERTGKAKSRKGKAARQRGTTVTVSGLFKPLPVRRKELERNAKREFGKALTLLHAYALVPCAQENKGVRLSVTNQAVGGKKSSQLRTDGTPSTRASVSAIWGPKALENLVDLELDFHVEVEAAVLRRLGKTQEDGDGNEVKVRGLISKSAVGCGRNGTDRQFFFVNGRPCAPSKVQKAFNEVYRSFNATQSPFVIADFILPTNSCDINVSPDKRTILLHSENNLVQALKIALEEKYAPARSTFDVNATQAPRLTQSLRKADSVSRPAAADLPAEKQPLFLEEDADEEQSPDSSQSVSLAAPESAVPEARAASPDREDEVSFGQPSLLIDDCSSPSGDPQVSQEPAVDQVDHCEHMNELVDHNVTSGDTLPTSYQLRNASVSLGSSTDSRQSIPRAPAKPPARQRSPTVTQMVAKQRTRAPSPATLVPAENERTEPEVLELATDNDDTPIATVKPPARPVTRPSMRDTPSASSSSSLSARKSEQMVLSTAGASWNLRRPADDLRRDGEGRPSKRSRQDSGGEDGPARGGSSRRGIREMLRGFARMGSTVGGAGVDEDEDEDDDDAKDGVNDAAAGGMDVDDDLAEDGEDEGGGVEPNVAAPNSQEGAVDEAVAVDEVASVLDDVQDVEMEDRAQDVANIAEIAHMQGAAEVIEVLDDDEPMPSSQSQPRDHAHTGSSSAIATAVSEEIIRTNDREGVTLSLDISRITAAWKELQTRLANAQREQRASTSQQDVAGPSGSVDAADEEATEALSRVIDKADFATMEVVGQFNLGFIIVRRQKTAEAKDLAPEVKMDDLFIVDQHAADEKYNFETLQQTTKIDSQKLFQPQTLELTAADELVALENMDVLRQNGFELSVCEDRPPGQRVRLEAQPISKSTVFDTKDLEELLHLLQDGGAPGHMVRCSKARAMFAMRACRMSIMIGRPLSRRQMTSVVQHMGTMDQPWHCPHGRPTMRHLSDIAGVGWDYHRGRAAEIDWAAFGRAEG